MNGINGIRNEYNHLKALSAQTHDLSFHPKTGINNVLPSITNLNNVSSADISFNSYLNSDSIPISHPNLMINDYQHNGGSMEYSLPAMRGFSHMSSHSNSNNSSNASHQYNYNTNHLTHHNCNRNEIQYQYQDFHYNPIIADNGWIDSYTSDCLKPTGLPHNALYAASHSGPPMSHSSDSGKQPTTKSLCTTKTHGKDEKYSVRRQKNNIAAKKCRDNKKQKNQELCDLIMKYEKENDELKSQISCVKSKIEEFVKQLR